MGRHREGISPKADPQGRIFGTNLARLVEASGKMIDDLKRETGTGRSTWDHMLNGTQVPSVRALPKYAKALGCKVSDLVPDDLPIQVDAKVGKPGTAKKKAAKKTK